MGRVLFDTAAKPEGGPPQLPPLPKTAGDLEALLRKALESQERAEAALVVLVKKAGELGELVARLRPWMDELEKRLGPPGAPKPAGKSLLSWLTG